MFTSKYPLLGAWQKLLSWDFKLLETAKNTQIFLAIFVPQFNQLHETFVVRSSFSIAVNVSPILSSMDSNPCSKFKNADI